MTVGGMPCVDLSNETLTMLGTYFYYNEKLKEEKKFWDCNRYPASIENMENETLYTRMENRSF